ncbi:hypothetical protein STENM327S_07817 [Streptomyces tendae]
MNASTLHRYCAGDAVPLDFARGTLRRPLCGATPEQRGATPPLAPGRISAPPAPSGGERAGPAAAEAVNDTASGPDASGGGRHQQHGADGRRRPARHPGPGAEGPEQPGRRTNHAQAARGVRASASAPPLVPPRTSRGRGGLRLCRARDARDPVRTAGRAAGVRRRSCPRTPTRRRPYGRGPGRPSNQPAVLRPERPPPPAPPSGRQAPPPRSRNQAHPARPARHPPHLAANSLPGCRSPGPSTPRPGNSAAATTTSSPNPRVRFLLPSPAGRGALGGDAERGARWQETLRAAVGAGARRHGRRAGGAACARRSPYQAPAKGNAYAMDQGCGGWIATPVLRRRPGQGPAHRPRWPETTPGTPIPAVQLPPRLGEEHRGAAGHGRYQLVRLPLVSGTGLVLAGPTPARAVDDDGRPFRTSAIKGLPRYTYDTLERRWGPYV